MDSCGPRQRPENASGVGHRIEIETGRTGELESELILLSADRNRAVDDIPHSHRDDSRKADRVNCEHIARSAATCVEPALNQQRVGSRTRENLGVNIAAESRTKDNLSLIHISEPTRQ